MGGEGLSDMESETARFPESRAKNRHNFCSERHNDESNRNRAESRTFDSESPIRIATYQCLAATLESHDSESPNSRFRMADSVPLRHCM